MKKEFTFLLEDEIQYSKDGEFVKTKKLLLIAPSNKQRRDVIRLQQSFMQAIKSSMNSFSDSKAKKTTGNETLKGDEIIAMLLMSEIDICAMLDSFRDLLLSGSCLLDGKVDFKEIHFDEISINDSQKLMGEFIANFLLPSVIQPAKVK